MSDDRVAELEKRVEALEAQVRVLIAGAEEVNRVNAAIDGAPPKMPELADRDDAVLFVGAALRTIIASVPPNERAKAIAEGSPAETLAAVGAAVPAANRPQFEAFARYARAHSLTWDDLGVSA